MLFTLLTLHLYTDKLFNAVAWFYTFYVQRKVECATLMMMMQPNKLNLVRQAHPQYHPHPHSLHHVRSTHGMLQLRQKDVQQQ